MTRFQIKWLFRFPVTRVVVDSDWYLSTYPDVRDAVSAGQYRDALEHYLRYGMAEGRMPRPPVKLAPGAPSRLLPARAG